MSGQSRAMERAMDEARSRDIRAVFTALGGVVTSDGRKGYCPDHSRGPGRGTPSVSFRRGKDGRHRFKCFGCDAGGDALDAVQAYTGADLKGALEYLSGPLPEVKRKWKAPPEEERDVPLLRRVQAATAFHGACADLSPSAREWLRDERGIDPAVAASMGLRVVVQDRGVQGQSAERALEATINAVGAADTQALGLAKASGKGLLYCPLYGQHLVIPYHGPDGRVVHLQFRRLSRSGSAKGPKYRHMRGTVPVPWGLDALSGDDERDVAVLTEGALDALAVRANGQLAVGIPGTQWLTPARAQRLVARSHRRLVVAFDADEAGAKGQRQAVKRLLEHDETVGELEWPEDFEGDWCDWFLTGRDDDLRVVEPVELREAREQEGRVHYTLTDAVVEAARARQDEALGRTAAPLVTTGLGEEVDAVLATRRGELTIVGARPGVGKSHLALSSAMARSQLGLRTGLVSLEMGRHDLGDRVVCAHVGLTDEEWYRKPVDYRVTAAAKCEDEAGLYDQIQIDHGDSRDVDGVIGACQRLIDSGCEALWLDHVQHVKGKRRDRWDVVDSLVRRLVEDVIDPHGVPVYLLAQFTRGASRRDPCIDDFKDCGSLEEVAHRAIGLSNPTEKNNEGEVVPVKTKVKVSKLKDRSRGLRSDFVRLMLPTPFGFYLHDDPRFW